MANPFKNKGSSGSSDPMYLFQKHPSNTSEPFGSIFSANPSPAFGNQDATKTADNTKLFSGNTFSSSIFTSTNTMFTSPPNSNDPPKQDPIKQENKSQQQPKDNSSGQKLEKKASEKTEVKPLEEKRQSQRQIQKPKKKEQRAQAEKKAEQISDNPPKEQPRKKKIVIKDSQKIGFQIQEKKSKIQSIQTQSLRIKKELLLLNDQEQTLKHDEKKTSLRYKYLIDNRPENKEEILKLENHLGELKIKIAHLNTRIQEIKHKSEVFDKREDVQTHELLELEEHLELMNSFQILKQKISSITNQIKQNIDKYQTATSNYVKKYQQAATAQIKQFLFGQLIKFASEGKKLEEQRDNIKREIQNSQFSEQIDIDENKFLYQVTDFTDCEQYYDYLIFLVSKAKEGRKVTSEQKRIQMMERYLKEEDRQLIERMKKIDFHMQEERIKQKEKVQERRKKREEEEKAQAQRREEEKKKRADQEERKKRQKEEKEKKYFQLLFTLQSKSKDVEKSLQHMKSIEVTESQGFQKLKDAVTVKQSLLKELKQNKDQLSSFLKEISPLSQELVKQSEIQSFISITQSTTHHLDDEQSQLQGLRKRCDELYLQEQNRKREEEAERERLRELQLSKLPPFQTNFYQDQVQEIRTSLQQKPETLRFLSLYQKYINQLRIVLQLSTISPEELKVYKFDKERYINLASRKTDLIQKWKLTSEMSEQYLGNQESQGMMKELDSIQDELSPMQSIFDQKYVKSLLYKYPKEMVSSTKQQLFQLSQQKKLRQSQQQLLTLREQTQKMSDLVTQKQKIIASLEQQKQRSLKKQEEEVLKYEKQLKNQFRIPTEQRVLEDNHQQLQFKITVRGEEELKKMYEQLNDDSVLTRAKAELEEVILEKEREKQLYQEAKEFYWQEIKRNKQRIVREVYIGDYQKARNDPKVQKLSTELKELKNKYEEKRNSKNHKHIVDRSSQFRLVSSIEEY